MFIILIVNRSRLRLGIVGMLLFATCTYRIAVHPNLQEWKARGIVVSEVKTAQKIVALTFDDGPHPHATPSILDLLDQYNAKATFFVVGVNAEKYPWLVKEIHKRGNEVGNHGFSHKISSYNDANFAKNDLEKNEELICRLTGQKPHLVRPPGGFLSRALVEYCQSRGLIIVTWTWNMDFKDWKASEPKTLARSIVENVKPGQIILLHDGGENRQVLIQALEQVFPQLANQGYKCVTVSQLMDLTKRE